MNFYYSLVFMLGAITDIIDNYVDTQKNLTNYHKCLNNLLQVILIFFIIYLVYFKNKFSDIITIISLFGGIIGYLFAKNIINSKIWIAIICITIPNFVINFKKYTKYVTNLLLNNKYYFLRNYVFFVIPLFIGATIFSLIEHKLFPEEISKKKLINRILQIIVGCIFILLSDNVEKILNIDKNIMNNLLFLAYGWLGYVTMSTVGISLNLIF